MSQLIVYRRCAVRERGRGEEVASDAGGNYQVSSRAIGGYILANLADS